MLLSSDVQSIIPKFTSFHSEQLSGSFLHFSPGHVNRSNILLLISKLEKKEDGIYHPRPDPEVKPEEIRWDKVPSPFCSPPRDKIWWCVCITAPLS